MRIPAASWKAIAALLALAGSSAIAAEFREGADAYARKDFARARAVFLDLAALGDGISQHNLGAMALRGEGFAADRGEAAGWMLAARQNGHDPTPRALADLAAKLSPAEREAADRIVRRFGRAALEASVLSPRVFEKDYPDPALRLEAPRRVSGPDPQYPNTAWKGGAQAIVILRVVMGADGRPRDPQVVVSIPPVSEGGRPFVESAARAMLARRYEPARLEGRAIAVNYNVRVTFRLREYDGVLKRDLVFAARAAAQNGDPRSQFLAGIVGLAEVKPGFVDRRTGDSYQESFRMIVSAAQAGVPEAQLFVGRAALRAGAADAAATWLERAAAAGVPGARTAYGLALLLHSAPDVVKARSLLDDVAAADDGADARRAITVLSCSTDERLRSPDVALAIASRLSADDADPLTPEATAAARASSGDFRGAADAERQAVKRARKLGWDVTSMQARLDAYAAGRPCTADFLPHAIEGR
jgi:TPR repeat protein